MRVLNAFSVSMLALPEARVTFKEVPLSLAQDLARRSKLQSAVGHADTAALFSDLLKTPVEFRRATVSMWPDEAALLGQYAGPRLPEGTTALPEGATVKWFTVMVEDVAEKRAILLRGLPGSGKSTYWDEHLPGAGVVCSADDFFVVEGRYQFDPSKLGLAHGACLKKYQDALQAGVQLVVVDNTNISVVELAPYVALAQAAGYATEIRTIECDPVVAAERNVHGVPGEAVARMAVRAKEEAERFPPWWNHRIIAIAL